MLLRLVVRDGVVQRADVVPHQHVALRPLVRVLVPRLKLVLEEQGQHAIALSLVELVDADGVAGVAVENVLAGDRVRQKTRVHGRRPLPALLRRQRIAQAPRPPAHVLPELVEVVGRRRRPQPRLDFRSQVLIGRLGVGEHGGAEHAAVAAGDLDGVEDVQEADGLVVGHVGVHGDGRSAWPGCDRSEPRSRAARAPRASDRGSAARRERREPAGSPRSWRRSGARRGRCPGPSLPKCGVSARSWSGCPPCRLELY
jgi:hypothetical protein